MFFGRRHRNHVLEAAGEHTHTVIFLHGRGSNGPQVALALSLMSTSAGINIFEHFPSVKWVFPTTQLQSSRWFEGGLPDDNKVPAGLKTSMQMLQQVIKDEIQTLGGDVDKVVLGGISQGLATAFHVLLCGDHKLGAFVGVSGWLPMANKIEQAHMSDVTQITKYLRKALGLEGLLKGFVEAMSKFKDVLRGNAKPGDGFSKDGSSRVVDTPIFLGHGSFDGVINVEFGKQACRILRGLKMDVTWKEYVGADCNGHWLKEPEELDDIVEFIQSCLPLLGTHNS